MVNPSQIYDKVNESRWLVKQVLIEEELLESSPISHKDTFIHPKYVH